MRRARGIVLRGCPVPGCCFRIPHRHVACADHWKMIPTWLQQRLTEQLHYGIAWKCHPTQEFLDLRSQAIQIVADKSAKKYARPGPNPQLPLLPTT